MKTIVYRILAFILFILFIPLFVLLYFIVKLDSRGSFIFRQERAGKDKKPFIFYKIRTMVEGAERLKERYFHLNEADGPVFKIRHDPRYTNIGKFLAHTGLDEIPQLVNIIKGEMSFVGPRPLPVRETEFIPKKYQNRFSTLPGMTSPWVIEGAHNLDFDQWMRLDLKYIERQSLTFDLRILLLTARLVLTLIYRKFFDQGYEKT